MSRDRVNTAKWSETEHRWIIYVQRDGVRHKCTSSTPGRQGQREANRKADKWLDCRQLSRRTKVSVMCDQLLDHMHTKGISDKRVRDYRTFFRRWLIPTIGDKRIDDVTVLDLERVLLKGYQDGKAKVTLQDWRKTMMQLLRFARKAGATTLRPEDPLEIPKDAPPVQRAALQPSELATLLREDKTADRRQEAVDYCIHAYRLAAVTGLRPGELLALPRHGYIKGGCLLVRRGVDDRGNLTGGKNDNAQRDIGVNGLVDRILRDQEALLDEMGVETDYLFCMPNGRMILEGTFRARWHKYRQHNGITTDTPPYGLRHTFASVCKDVPIELVKLIMGHSAAMDTFGNYGHRLDGDVERAAQRVEEAFVAVLQNTHP